MRRIFVAGATGAIGRRLTPILLDEGLEVAGTTRSPEKAAQLQHAGVRSFVVDVFDRVALGTAVRDFAPEVVIHQLTDLPDNLDPQHMSEALERNARMRRDGTRNLVEAATAAGTRRLIAQSIAWAYAPDCGPHAEDHPLDVTAIGPRATTIGGVVALESAVLNAPGMESLVLRYGQIYGPGTGAERPAAGRPAVHVDAAAQAAFLAIDKGRPGIYNVAEGGAGVTSEKAQRELGWSAQYRLTPH